MRATRTLLSAAASAQPVMPAHIIPEARSTYRALLRASSKTFAGDKPSQTQFRGIIRDTFASPTLSSPLAKNTPPPPKPSQKPKTACESYASSLEDRSSSSLAEKEAEQMSEAEYQERLKHWREVAAILRQNVVQGRKVEKEANDAQVSEKAEGLTGEDGNVWKLRITPDTELGDNHTIRTPPKLPTTPFPNRERNRRRRQQQQEQST